MKDQSVWFSGTNRGLWAMSPSTWNLRLNRPTPFDKRQLRPISAYNDWTIRANENVQLSRTGSWPRTFQRAIDKVCTLPLTYQRLSQKAIDWISTCIFASSMLLSRLPHQCRDFSHFDSAKKHCVSKMWYRILATALQKRNKFSRYIFTIWKKLHLK